MISNPEAIIPGSLTECECELSNFLGQGSSQITQKGSIALRDPNISNGPVVIIRDAYICSDSRRTLLPDITCYKQGVHFQNDPRGEVRVVDVETGQLMLTIPQPTIVGADGKLVCKNNLYQIPDEYFVKGSEFDKLLSNSGERR